MAEIKCVVSDYVIWLCQSHHVYYFSVFSGIVIFVQHLSTRRCIYNIRRPVNRPEFFVSWFWHFFCSFLFTFVFSMRDSFPDKSQSLQAEAKAAGFPAALCILSGTPPITSPETPAAPPGLPSVQSLSYILNMYP